MQDLSKVQKQKAVLESSLQHTQQKLEILVEESTAEAEKAAASLAEALRLNTEYGARLEECQQSFMELEEESDAQLCALQAPACQPGCTGMSRTGLARAQVVICYAGAR